MPWSGTAPPFGFSPNPDTWLPMPNDWAPLTVAEQLADPASTLNFFRSILGLRRNTFQFCSRTVEWLPAGPGLLAFRSGGVLCVLNTSGDEVLIPAGRVIAASAPTDGAVAPESAVWIVEN
jgi:alpha-glucosidase